VEKEIVPTLLDAVGAVRGHFVYESGHHGDLWLDLDMLFVDAGRAHARGVALAGQAVACAPDFVCGPLTGGAFVAQSVAAELGAGFVFAERIIDKAGTAHYRIPESLRHLLSNKRVLLVDDAINAGSAVRATLVDLLECHANLAGLAALLTLGEAAAQIAQEERVPLFALTSLERAMWTPAACPLCRSGVQLIDLCTKS
jgi:orotate phosphoribosyltransferase